MTELKLNRLGYRRMSGKFINDFQDDLDWEYVSTCKLYKGYFDSAPKYVKLYITLNYRDVSRYL